MSSLMRKINRQILVAKKQSPHIFFGLGVLGTITSTVLACRATLKLSDTLDDIQHEIDGVKELRHSDESESLTVVKEQSRYPIEEWRKDTAYVYTKAGVRLVRLYGPSIVIGVVSIGMLTGSHVQLSRRNAGLMAAYAALQKAYDEYRVRVQEELGVDREHDIHYAMKSELVANEDGTMTKKFVRDPNQPSEYVKFFDEFSSNWKRDPELNRLFLLCQQNCANTLLNSRGHLFLNEVYDMLDVGRTSAGAVVGWVIGDEGDNHVDFGIFDPENSRFVNGWEQSILLDFNVDGVIWDKI